MGLFRKRQGEYRVTGEEDTHYRVEEKLVNRITDEESWETVQVGVIEVEYGIETVFEDKEKAIKVAKNLTEDQERVAKKNKQSGNVVWSSSEDSE